MEILRWHQRYSNFIKALSKLEEAVQFIKKDKKFPLEQDSIIFDDILREGLIQRFEYTHELAWNVFKDYANYQGISNISGSRDATREAFQMGLISNGQVWMHMIGSRNSSSHTYNESTASEIFNLIIDNYFQAFIEFKATMDAKI